MRRMTRRSLLAGIAAGGGLVWSSSRTNGTHVAQETAPSWSLEPLGHSLLGAPPVEFAEGAVRADGAYAAVGTWNGDEYGSFLVDLSDPANPQRAHYLQAPDRVMNLDVKFDPRDGLYYRCQEPIEDQETMGVEIVDYGYADGSPADPVSIGRADAGPTHNVFPHPAEPLLYAVNHDQDRDTKGLEIWDVSDPTSPERLSEVGRPWSLHDVTFDPDSELLHCAYGKGYVAMDASDAASPTEVGAFEYEGRPSYEEVGPGNEGFETGHLAKQYPGRDLVVMGDEVSTGVPGGKHILDIGWGEGTLEDPVSVGFTKSPNAEVQEPTGDQSRGDIVFDWTGHNFDVVPWGDYTLLVSGDWHEGAVLYDITDPRDPTPLDRYPTDDRADEKPGRSRWGPPPMAFSAVYNAERDLVVASDVVTGLYTFRIAGEPRPTRTETGTESSSGGGTAPGARGPPAEESPESDGWFGLGWEVSIFGWRLVL